MKKTTWIMAETKRNHNFKGGHVASNGYRMQYVGKEHHLADVRGYAYEHRIVAEKKYGRRLRKGEEVHHDDENKLNNNPDNLIIKKSKKEHFASHRKAGKRRRNPGERNPMVNCQCGCKIKLRKFDNFGRIRNYISGHNPQTRNMKGRFE